MPRNAYESLCWIPRTTPLSVVTSRVGPAGSSCGSAETPPLPGRVERDRHASSEARNVTRAATVVTIAAKPRIEGRRAFTPRSLLALGLQLRLVFLDEGSNVVGHVEE